MWPHQTCCADQQNCYMLDTLCKTRLMRLGLMRVAKIAPSIHAVQGACVLSRIPCAAVLCTLDRPCLLIAIAPHGWRLSPSRSQWLLWRCSLGAHKNCLCVCVCLRVYVPVCLGACVHACGVCEIPEREAIFWTGWFQLGPSKRTCFGAGFWGRFQSKKILDPV